MGKLLRTLTGIMAVAFVASAQAADMTSSRSAADHMVVALHVDRLNAPSPAIGETSPFDQAASLRQDEAINEHKAVPNPAGPMATSDPRAVAVNETRDLGKIPEPRSWAMMLFGFTLVGTALRRKPRRVPQAA